MMHGVNKNNLLNRPRAREVLTDSQQGVGRVTDFGWNILYSLQEAAYQVSKEGPYCQNFIQSTPYRMQWNFQDFTSTNIYSRNNRN
jgi:hypothetical protein